MPGNTDAERGLLSACMIDEQGAFLMRCIEAGITARAFSDARHGLLWSGIKALHDEGTPIDYITLSEQLHKTQSGLHDRHENALDAVGGMGFVSSIEAACDITAHADSYLGLVLDHWADAKIREFGHKVSIIAEDRSKTAADKMAAMQPVLDALERASVTNNGRPQIDAADAARAKAERIIAGIKSTKPQIRFGFGDLDKYLLPISVDNEDYLTTVAARPSRAKSSLARTLAWQAVMDGLTVVYVSLENSADRVVGDIAQSMSKCNTAELHNEIATRQEAYLKWCDRVGYELSRGRFWIYEDKGISAIETRLKHMYKKLGNIDLIVLDYLNILQQDRSYDRRDIWIHDACMRFRSLAKDSFGCCFVMCAQLNRDADYKTGMQGQFIDNPPRMSNLKDGGGIEEVSDRVLLLHRPPYMYNAIEKQWNGISQMETMLPRYDTQIIQVKMRNGPVYSVRCQFEGRTKTFF